MAMLVNTVGVAAQAAAEATGTAVTAGVVAGSTPAMSAAVPMGAEEVSALIASAAAEHTAQFLSMAGLNLTDHAMFASDIGVSGAIYGATEAVNVASMAL